MSQDWMAVSSNKIPYVEPGSHGRPKLRYKYICKSSLEDFPADIKVLEELDTRCVTQRATTHPKGVASFELETNKSEKKKRTKLLQQQNLFAVIVVENADSTVAEISFWSK